ncbi:hypothetical protein HYR54_15855 [Candidatus Acetothermia bacterium]|nr:hypothetical protein [Candidatus Acetothermia bacterium]
MIQKKSEVHDRLLWQSMYRFGFHDKQFEELSPVEQEVVLKELAIAMAIDSAPTEKPGVKNPREMLLAKCPCCGEHSLKYENGCSFCLSCGYGKCDA